MPKPRPAQLLRSRGLDPREFVFRAIIVTLILGSAFGAWWTFMRVLPPLQLKSRQLASDLSKLQTKADDLDRQWSKTQMEDLTNQYLQAQSMLISGRPALGEWLTKLKTDSKSLALTADTKEGVPRSVPAPGFTLAVVPATISVEVRPTVGPGATSSYQRVLQLAERLCSDSPGSDLKRADPVGLSVSGGVGSVTNLVLTVDLWAGEEAGP
jgi:hypothetical protein